MKALKKTLAVLTAIACMTISFPVSAVELNGTSEMVAMGSMVGDTASPQAAGLISNYTLYCGPGVSGIEITASVAGTDQMAKIGFKDIKVQRSITGNGGWTTVVEPNDQVIQNAYSHQLSAYPISVSGGYYYRVILTNYAKEMGWFFPKTQEVSCTSNVIFLPY